MLKEQAEIASKLLEAIRQVIGVIDFEKGGAEELALTMNEIGTLVSQAMVLSRPEALDSALRILRREVGAPKSIAIDLKSETETQTT